jgi:hypothetical protein
MASTKTYALLTTVEQSMVGVAVTAHAMKTTGDARIKPIDLMNNISKNKKLLFRQLSSPHRYLLQTSLPIRQALYALTQLGREKDTMRKSSKL